MAVVKGSKQERLSLVRYDPWQRFVHVIYFLLFIAAVAGGCFFAGQYASLNERRALSAERDQLQEQIMAADQEIRGFSQRVGALEKGGEVDRQAAEGIRQTVKSLKAQIATLEEEVSFYKGIMAPSGQDKGLRISKIDIQPLDQPNTFRYSIMMTQVADNTSYIKGLAAVNFVGLEDGKRKILPLRELDGKVEELGVKFSFRYFQEVGGEISIPANFNLEQVQVVLQSTGSKAQRVEETIEWLHKDS
ncbi:MAG: Tfp pilus assembly protein PilO [Oleispira sp.]|jgi:Tfp pilus assembly protein PilO